MMEEFNVSYLVDECRLLTCRALLRRWRLLLLQDAPLTRLMKAICSRGTAALVTILTVAGIEQTRYKEELEALKVLPSLLRARPRAHARGIQSPSMHAPRTFMGRECMGQAMRCVCRHVKRLAPRARALVLSRHANPEACQSKSL